MTVMTSRSRWFWAGFVAVVFAIAHSCAPIFSPPHSYGIPQPASAADLVIRDVTVIDGTGAEPLTERTVVVADGHIIEILSGSFGGSSDNEIDGRGKFLIPGLIDGHCHPSIAGLRSPDGPEFYAAVFEPMVRFGVTSAVLYGGSRGSYASMADMSLMSETGEVNAPRVFYTSPIVTMDGAHPLKTYIKDAWVENSTILIPRSLQDIDKIVADAARQEAIGVKIIVEDGPTPPFIDRMPSSWVRRFVQKGHELDVPIYAHVSDMHEVRTCVEAGVHTLVHFWGVQADWDEDEATIDSMVEQDISWVTTLVLGRGLAYSPQHPEWLDREEIRSAFDPALLDSIRALASAEEARELLDIWTGDPELPLAEFFEPDVTGIQEAYRRGVNIVLGTDLGNNYVLPGISLHDEMEILQNGGISPADILRMGTHNAAKMIGRLDDLGTIEVGKLADMVLLTENPLLDITNALAIDRVFIGGIER